MSVVTSQYLNDSTPIHVHGGFESVSNWIIQHNNFYEIEFLDFIRQNFYEQRGIIDIGANIGNHSLFFSKFLKNDIVHCFEPYKANLELLRKNMTDRKCIIYDIALSDHEGELPLYNSQQLNYGGFSLHSYSDTMSFKVLDSIPVTTLDSFNLSNISMIKIDVENHENEVLIGARQTILRNKPIIFLENLYHGFPAVCPNPNPHDYQFEQLNYVKKYSNIHGGFMDLWVPKE